MAQDVTGTTRRVVGISELVIGTTRDEELVTYSLGSCLGIAAFDPVAGVGGLMHCLLPFSKVDPEKARDRPAMFVDTGVIHLLQELYDHGALRERLVVKVAGGASPMDRENRFRIGERNFTVLRKVLWKNEVLLAADEIGGTTPRTMSLLMSDGTVRISTGGRQWNL
jgi:chemotaxis protein CheD